MAADTANAQIHLDPAGRIAQDIHCAACRYNLRGLSPDQSCPECNAPVAPSLKGDRLQFADPAWLARLVSGLTWILVASILSLAFTLAVRTLLVRWLAGTGFAQQITVFLGVPLLLTVARLIGAWKVTSPDPRVPAAFRVMDVRVASRILLLAGFVLMGARVATGFRPLLLASLLGTTGHLLSTAGWIALFLYLARLARRIPAPRLARFTRPAVVTLAALAGVSAALSFAVMHAISRNATGPGTGFTALMLAEFVLSLCASLLQLILVILYRIQLRRVARQAQYAAHSPSAAPEAPLS